MSEALKEYYEALERLKANKPITVPKGTKITKDAVSLEAGRKKGTIKKSRTVFRKLIEDIENISEKKKEPIQMHKQQADLYKSKYEEYKSLYEDALNRELMYIERINELEKRLPQSKAVNNF